jgi:tetratricopeptide (TPR) repeat protein
VADSQKQSGDLYGARETYATALRTAEEVMRLPDARVFDRSMLAHGHHSLSSILGNPDELNLGDRPGALSHVRKAVEMAEAIAASDQQDVRALDDLSMAYRGLAGILLEDGPGEALKWYQKAASISEKLNAGDPSNTRFRHNFAVGHLGMGESLLRLGKNREALQNLAPALEMIKSLTGSARDQIFLIGELGRIHRAIGNALLSGGDEAGALKNYRQGLAATDDLIRRAPSSLYFWRQHADALESLGRYYATLARRRRELKAEARLWLQKSLGVWQDWKRRKVGAPYAGVREAQVTAFIASIDSL